MLLIKLQYPKWWQKKMIALHPASCVVQISISFPGNHPLLIFFRLCTSLRDCKINFILISLHMWRIVQQISLS